ncbi:MAG: PilZ domain-containing protein [Anaerolineales bacterium]|jgi:hypothetical protein
MHENNTLNEVVQGSARVHMYTTPDRRVKPRIDCDYPAIIKGYDVDGTKFNDRAKLANLSASGLFMMANRYVENGSRLSVTVLLSNSLIDKDAPKLATNGIVVRTEPQTNGTCGIAIKFYQYRFL